MLYVLYLCLLINISLCSEVELSTEVHKSLDYVLCRYCGNNISTTESIISKLSPASVRSFNDTVFNKEEILVQVLSKDYLLEIPIITSTYSTCLAIGEWEEDDHWFPGYHWKTCVCSECGLFLGWIFEPIDTLSVVVPEQFYGLILDHLASESCKYSFSFWDLAKLCCLVSFTCVCTGILCLNSFVFDINSLIYGIPLHHYWDLAFHIDYLFMHRKIVLKCLDLFSLLRDTYNCSYHNLL